MRAQLCTIGNRFLKKYVNRDKSQTGVIARQGKDYFQVFTPQGKGCYYVYPNTTVFESNHVRQNNFE